MSAQHVQYVLIGGGLASSAAAQAIRQIDPDGAMLLLGQEVNRPYHRPQLSNQYLLAKKARPELLTLDDHWFIDHHVELRTGVRATQLDLARNALLLSNGAEVFYDNALIATGGTPRQLTAAGAHLPNIFYLRTLDDADRLKNAVEQARREGRPHERGRGRAAILGAGLLGVELASTFTQMGLHVDLVFPAAHPWAKLAGEVTGRFLAKHLETHAVRLHPLASVRALEGDGRVQRVILASGQTLECDFVVPALGMVPHKELLRGTTLAAEKAILTDPHCRTNHPNVYAAGDCAAIFDPLFGKHRLLDHWESAVETGRIAGLNMAGHNETYSAVSGFSSRVFDTTLSAWGEARHVERRILRGTAGNDLPAFIEIGVTGDGRISQILAVNGAAPSEVLRQLVLRRYNVNDKEHFLRDPGTNLESLLD